MEQRRAEEEQQRAMKFAATTGSSSSEKDQEGYWAYMQRQMQERTENLNIMGDKMDHVEESSSSWADDVNKYISKQKKKAVMGCKCLENVSGHLHIADATQSLGANSAFEEILHTGDTISTTLRPIVPAGGCTMYLRLSGVQKGFSFRSARFPSNLTKT